jgi:hypothetical protein
MAAVWFVAAAWLPAAAPDPKPAADKVKEVAGTAEFLRSVPKRFATLTGVDPARHRVTLLIDGEGLPKEWALNPEAEVKYAGWWGRLDQFTPGDRVWVWFETNRNKQPVAVSMLADELSEQDTHGPGVTVQARGAGAVTVRPVKGKERVLQAAAADVYRGREKVTKDKALDGLRAGEKVYVQSAGDRARLILDPAAFEARRADQKAALRQRWVKEGLPGTVVFLHRFSGEMEFMLDHEAQRWGRSLKPGEQVTLRTATPITAVVRQVRPWRERTQVRLVVAAPDLGDLTLGQRVNLRMPPPTAEIDSARLPPDLDRPRSKEERVEWFLASIYCTCGVDGDVCTGHFYTLASCNPNGCGMPNHMRRKVAERIEKGLTDRQIFEELLKQYGPDLLRPHLLP